MILYHCHLHTCTLDAHPSRCADVYKLANTKPITKFDFCTCTNMYLNLHSISSSSRSNMMVIHAHFTFAETTNIPFYQCLFEHQILLSNVHELSGFLSSSPYMHALHVAQKMSTFLHTLNRSLNFTFVHAWICTYALIIYIHHPLDQVLLLNLTFVHTRTFTDTLIFLSCSSPCIHFAHPSLWSNRYIFLHAPNRSSIFYFCTCTKMYLHLHFNLYHSD